MSEKAEYQVNEPVQSNVKTVDYDLPFYHYQKTTIEDPNTGKKRSTKKIIKKSYEELFTDVLIVSAGATAINLVGNGISHLIYACKKKKK